MIKSTILKIAFFLITAALPLAGFSQLTVIYGYVKSNSSGMGIANHQVVIQSHIDTITSTGMNYYSTVFTSPGGFFIDSVTVPTGQNIKFFVSTLDCQGNTVTDSVFSNQNTGVNLLICDSGLISCKADFIAYADTGNYKKYYFYNIAVTPFTNLMWHFGDGDSSTAINPVHIYAKDSLYPVSLTVYDTATGCSDTKNDTIDVKPVFYCSNSFTYVKNNLTVSFYGSVNNSLPTIYKWSFGDFSYATGQNPQHVYSNAGIYKTCLQTISVNPQNMDTCVAFSCKYISIQAPPMGNIWGQVFADTDRVYHGKVVLYKFIQSNGTYQSIDTVDVTNIDSLNLSFYYFGNIPFGKYITKAYLTSQSSNYNVFGPAFYGNSFKWDKTPAFILNQGGINKPIHLTHIYNANGPVDITGKVMEGTIKNPGDPIPGVLLYLYDVQGDVYGYTYSDNSGNYSFTGLQYRKYYVYADVINKDIFPAFVWPDESNNHLTNINIYIGKDKVTSIGGDERPQALVFPNPVSDRLNIVIGNAKAGLYKFELFDNLGRLILTRQRQMSPDNNTIKLNLNGVPNGFYSLMIKSGDGVSSVIKVIVSH